jgi:predicted dehydrogenase
MRTTGKLRVVQVGCGKRAQAHVAAMLASGAIDLVALCDLDQQKLHATGEKFGISRRYRDMEAMIRAEEPELVNIVTPPIIRAAIVEPAIAAGAPALLIEKPLALTPSESRRLVVLGRDRLIAVNTQYQWMPHWQRFWGLLAKRGLGAVRTLRASTRCNLLEQGPHILDLALNAAALSGLPDPEWVLAACDGLERFGPTPVPADTSATIGLGEARLYFNAGPSAPEVPGETVIWYQQQVEIIGERGRLWVSLNQGWSLWQEDGSRPARPAGRETTGKPRRRCSSISVTCCMRAAKPGSVSPLASPSPRAMPIFYSAVTPRHWGAGVYPCTVSGPTPLWMRSSS